MKPSTFLWLVKLFEMNLTANECSKQLQVSYPTASRAFNLIRESICLGEASKGGPRLGAVEVDEAFFGGKISRDEDKRKIPVLGLKFREGRVKLVMMEKVNASSITKVILKHVEFGSTIYTDCFKGYHHLNKIGYVHKSINHKVCFARGDVHTNGIEGVWSYVKKGLVKYNSITKKNFHLYLTEQEFRFNYRSEPKFEKLITMMMEFVPRS